MTKYISILRGINVSGQRKMEMARLRQLYEQLGLNEVVSYIQSGNLVFESAATKGEIKQRIESKIEEVYGFAVPVFVVEATELQKYHTQNPFLDTEQYDINSLHLTLLDSIPNSTQIENIDIAKSADSFAIAGNCVYLHCPNGYGRTKLTNAFWEKKLATTATTRNWKTICKLLEMVK